MSSTLAEKVRQRLSHAFNPDVAAVAGLSVQQLHRSRSAAHSRTNRSRIWRDISEIKERVDG